MPLFRVFYNGPTDWEIEADSSIVAELQAYYKVDVGDFNAEEIEDEETEK